MYVSRLVLDRRIAHPRQVVSIGDQVEVTVVEVGTEKRRIGLSMIEGAKRAGDAAENERAARPRRIWPSRANGRRSARSPLC